MNLDPHQIAAAITPNTTAILPVHCYERPCDVDRIQEIADNYNLKVIYDAAHVRGSHAIAEAFSSIAICRFSAFMRPIYPIRSNEAQS